MDQSSQLFLDQVDRMELFSHRGQRLVRIHTSASRKSRGQPAKPFVHSMGRAEVLSVPDVDPAELRPDSYTIAAPLCSSEAWLACCSFLYPRRGCFRVQFAQRP